MHICIHLKPGRAKYQAKPSVYKFDIDDGRNANRRNRRPQRVFSDDANRLLAVSVLCKDIYSIYT